MAVVLLLAACASSGPSEDPFAAERGEPTARVQVINHHAENITVHAVAPAFRERLGQVPGRTRRTFTFPWDPARLLQLELQFTRGARCTLGPFTVEPSARLDVEVPAGLDPRSCG